MSNILIVSNGYYTTLNAISVVDELNIGNKQIHMWCYFKQVVSEFNEQINVCKKSFNILSTLNYTNYYNNKNFLEYKFLQDTNNCKFNYILIPLNSSSVKWFNLFSKLYKDAEVIFFEEGLLSYIIPIFKFKLKKILNKRKCFFNNFNLGLNNFLHTHLSYASVNFMSNTIFKANIEKLKNNINIDFFNLKLHTSKNILFIPQYYHLKNPSKNRQKLDNYVAIAKSLIKLNYTILVKEHPKTDYAVYPFLINRLGTKNIINLGAVKNYPIELFLDDLNLDCVFSVYSTVLLTANSMYNIPVFSSSNMLKERINSLSLYPALSCYLTQQMFPKIEDFCNYYKFNSQQYYKQFVYNNPFYQPDTKITKLNLLKKFIFKV